MFPIFKPIPLPEFERYFVKATDADRIALWFRDVKLENLSEIASILRDLEGNKEIYVLLWQRCLGVEVHATVRVPSLRFFEEGRRLTFEELERAFSKNSEFFKHCLNLDLGYRSILVLTQKNRSNLLVLKRIGAQRKVEVPPFYRKDLDGLR